MSRIKLEMTITDAVIAMVDGNPGAIHVCMTLIRDSPRIDPQAALGGIAPILLLDTLKIYGPRIWGLYKDVCGEDITAMLAMIRGYQLGLISHSALDAAIDGVMPLDVTETITAVKERLSGFGRADAPEMEAS